MVAGESAGAEARRQLALAGEFERAAAHARETAGRFHGADVTERHTAVTLSPLTAVGHHLLADRGWPGSRTAQVDMVVVGPGGVFIVDTKPWKDVTILDGRIFRGQQDVTCDVLTLADLGSLAEADFAEVGLAPGEVRPVVVLAGREGIAERIGTVQIVGERDVLRHIASYGSRLTQAQVDTVLGRALALFPRVGEPAPLSTTITEPVLPRPRTEVSQDALLIPQKVNTALFEGIIARPIEEWMAFLHPAQAKLVRRSFNGPCRIRGGAGTGKTVVGLHRAAYLARTRPGTVLVTTNVRTLPGIMRRMLSRMAPDVAERVEFNNIHALARRLLNERGVTVNLQQPQVDNAMERAWHDVGAPGLLGSSGLARHYWEEEVQYVLKGRGITRFEQYADLPRTGRRHRLNPELRGAMWDLYQAYEQNLRSRGIHDHADVILLAEAELHRAPAPGRYAAVIVDEAQDLTCAMVRLLHAFAGNGPDGLTLIADGHQSIYPGGYTLAEAGISLAGRGAVLDVNFRNTVQILDVASRLVAGDEVADIEGGVAAGGDVPVTVQRTGTEPVIARCAAVGDRDDRMVERIRTVLQEIGTGFGDIGVLCLSKAGVARAMDRLMRAGVPVVELTDYSGAPVDSVKVGTVKRAKGLEFKQVLMADVLGDWMDAAAPEDDAAREHWERRRREMYVGMTRARDGLWVGVV